MKSVLVPFVAAVAGLSVLALPVSAARPAAHAPADAGAAPPQAERPVQPSEVKQFGDWIVRCYPVASPMPCQMLWMSVFKETRRRALGVLLAYVPSRDTHLIQVSVPLGVDLQGGLVLKADTYNSGVLQFDRCDQQGCYVEAAMDNDKISALARATKVEADVVAMNGHKEVFNLSMKGFNDAHKSLVDLARQKAVNPPAAQNDAQGDAQGQP